MYIFTRIHFSNCLHHLNLIESKYNAAIWCWDQLHWQPNKSHSGVTPFSRVKFLLSIDAGAALSEERLPETAVKARKRLFMTAVAIDSH